MVPRSVACLASFRPTVEKSSRHAELILRQEMVQLASRCIAPRKPVLPKNAVVSASPNTESCICIHTDDETRPPPAVIDALLKMAEVNVDVVRLRRDWRVRGYNPRIRHPSLLIAHKEAHREDPVAKGERVTACFLPRDLRLRAEQDADALRPPRTDCRLQSMRDESPSRRHTVHMHVVVRHGPRLPHFL